MELDLRKWKLRPPKGLAGFILENCAAQNYIIFSNKLDTAVCTACNRELRMSKYGMQLTHVSKGKPSVTCPRCGKKCIPKNARYGRKSLRDEGRIIWFRATGRVTFMELDNYIIDYRTLHPEIYVAPYQQIRLTRGEQIRMDWKDGWWGSPGKWEEIQTITVRAPRTAMYYGALEHTHVFWETLKHVGTDLKYADLRPKRFRGDGHDEYYVAKMLIGYISAFLKYQAVELLEKAGMQRMVLDYARGGRTRFMNIRGKHLRAILRMNGAEVRYVREENKGIFFLERVRQVRSFFPEARIEDIEDLAVVLGFSSAAEVISESFCLKKIMLLMMESNRRHERSMTLRDYMDYLGWIEKLGLRKDKRTIYPKDFVTAHDEMLQRMKDEEDRAILQDFRESMQRITGMTEPFTRGAFLIRPAVSPAELRMESGALEHCVRTYAGKVAKGMTSILFIRKIEKPDEPFFTLEYRDGRIVQCRGYKNCDYPEEVGKFIESWMKWMKRRKPQVTAA